MGSVHWRRPGRGKSWMGQARGLLPHGSRVQREQSRDCAGLAVWPGRVAGALWAWVDYTVESLLASGFICPGASPCCPPVPHSSPRRAQGRSVPSLTYLLFILRAWEDRGTGRPPAGRGLAELARSQGREGARRCLQPPRPPALQPPRTPSSALSPPQLS